MPLAFLVVQEFNYIGKKIANTINNLSKVEGYSNLHVCLSVSVCVFVCVSPPDLKTCNVTLMSEHMDLWILQGYLRIVPYNTKFPVIEKLL